MDIEDRVITAIQSYAQTLYPGGRDAMMAFAGDMAPHIVKELGLMQEWGVVRVFTYDRDEGPREEIDVVMYECDNPTAPARELEALEEYDRTFKFTFENGRRYVGTRLFTAWQEDTPLPLDSDLVELVEEDV